MKKAIVIFFILFLSGIVIKSSAQTTPHADHVALYVKDLDKSETFYRDVMQLPIIPEPFHDGKHVWLRTGEHSQLHLIQGPPKSPSTISIATLPIRCLIWKTSKSTWMRCILNTATGQAVKRCS